MAGRLAAVLLLLAGAARSQGLVHTIQGSGAHHLLGSTVAGAGDVDADGFADVIVGAPGSAFGPFPNHGSAGVISGRTGAVLHAWSGAATKDEFGCSVAGAGDVDADGYDDLIVGARLESKNGLADCGVARVYSGRTGLRLHVFAGSGNLNELGTRVAGAGDVNGDGHADLVVTAPFESPTTLFSGAVRIYSGADGTLLHLLHVPGAGAFGSDVAGLGDLDGDGFDDVAVGHGTDDTLALNAGAVRVYSGADGAPLYTLFGEAAGEALGARVASAGDVDGDGILDLAATAPFGDLVRVWSGATGAPLHTLRGEGEADSFGISCAGLGDVDGDGLSDLAVGASLADGGGVNSGRVIVFSGATGAELFRLEGDAAGDSFGASVAAAGDVNGDGVPDLVAGAPANDAGGDQAGSARVHSGRCGAIASHGAGCSGSGGITPQLSALGCAAPLCEVTLSITGGLGGGTALVFVGAGPSLLPMAQGCQLLVAPLLPPVLGPLLLAGDLPGGGAIALTGALPPMPQGVSFGLQAFVIDPGAPPGYANTNAVILTMP